jgi:hypothetical protein
MSSNFVDDDDEEIIRVENSNSKQRRINIKNIEPVKGIKVVRDVSPSISSEDSYSSDISEKKVKKTKKIIRKKEPYRQPQQHPSNDYSAFSNPKISHLVSYNSFLFSIKIIFKRELERYWSYYHTTWRKNFLRGI